MHSKKIKIVCAAIKLTDGRVVSGVRHYSPDMRETLRGIYGEGIRVFGFWLKKPYWKYEDEQGFITSKGEFVSRKHAFKIACAANQVSAELMPRRSLDIGLFSEDLY